MVGGEARDAYGPWSQLAQYLKDVDPYHHLLCYHAPGHPREMLRDNSMFDFDMVAFGHDGMKTVNRTAQLMQSCLEMSPQRPVLCGEACYEGHMQTNFQDHQRYMFWRFMLSGAAGHTYGAAGIWHASVEGDPGIDPVYDWTTWREGMRYPGSSQLAIGKTLLEEYTWWRFEPHPEWVEPDCFAAGIPGEVRFIYQPKRGIYNWKGTVVKNLEPDVSYAAFYFDPATGRRFDQGTVVNKEPKTSPGECQAPRLPSPQDWVLVLERVKKFDDVTLEPTDKADMPPSGTQAIVTIDTHAKARPYHRMIFGGFLEHFGRQIYGGVFEPGSPLADEKGFRLDVIEALKELKVPIIRWPGGCFVDAYHWQKGVGKKREPYGDPRWGVFESNAFGTHEFVELCRRIGAKPYICFNGLASVQENLDWVSYCNATEGEFAEMRKKNGHPEPFKVKFWSVGNERYDKAYIHRVRDTAKAMKKLFPEVLITCSGSQGGQGTSMRGIHDYLMEQAGDYLDYVSVHNYWLPRGNVLPRYDYLTAITKSEMPEAYVNVVSESLRKAGMGRIKIAFDEWNLRAWQHPGFPRNNVEDFQDPAIRELVERRIKGNDLADQYTMADALFTASFSNACLRHSKDVTMANIAPIVNTRGPLFVHPRGIVKRTHFHTLAMYANELQARVGQLDLEADHLRHGNRSIPVMDAVATVDESGKTWSIALVNRHPSEDVKCTVKLGHRLLDGTYRAILLTGESHDSYNDIENPDQVAPKDLELTFKKGVVDAPPHSLTIVHVGIE